MIIIIFNYLVHRIIYESNNKKLSTLYSSLVDNDFISCSMKGNLNTMSLLILPKNFEGAPEFGDTILHCHEAERVLEAIVKYQMRTTPENWHPFSFADYKARAAHPVNKVEEHIMDIMVTGGRLLEIDPLKELIPGCLTKDANGRYHVTDIFIQAVQPFCSVPTHS